MKLMIKENNLSPVELIALLNNKINFNKNNNYHRHITHNLIYRKHIKTLLIMIKVKVYIKYNNMIKI